MNLKIIKLLLFIPFVLLSGKDIRKDKLTGIWKLQFMRTKGIVMPHEQMGYPFLEFNDEGGFLMQFSASKEKGKYRLKGDKLTLLFKIPPKPAQIFTITKLTDKEMDYFSITGSDTVLVTCYKIIAEEKD